MSHDVSYIIIRQVAHQPHWGQVGGEVPVLIGSIEEERYQTERDHDEVLVLGFSAEVNGDVHDEDGRQIPQRPVQWFCKGIFML